MKTYTKPQVEVHTLVPMEVLANSPYVSNSLYQGDDTDSDCGAQFSHRHDWDDDEATCDD